MTSATGKTEVGTRSGFTLLEILVVIALLGLMAAVLVGGTVRLLDDRKGDLQSVALRAIAGARQEAVATGRTVALRSALLAPSGATASGKGMLRWLPPVMDATSLVGGHLAEEALPVMRFYADGTCDPFRVEISDRGQRHVFSIDPWTTAMLSEGKTK